MRIKLSSTLRRLLQIISVFLVILAVSFVMYKIFLDPYRGAVKTFEISEPLSKPLSQEQATEDLDLMMLYLEERHPAGLQGIPAKVKAQYELEIAALPEQITVLELWRSTSAILALMKDGHTSVSYLSEDQSELPVSFVINQDGLYLTWSDNGPYKVITIDGQPVKTLYADFIRHFSYEQEIYARYQFARRLPLKRYLDLLGLDTSEKIEITYHTPSGEAKTSFAYAQPDNEASSTEEPFVFFEIDPELSLGILRLRSCIYNKEYRSTLQEFFTQVKNQDIKHVAVDLRGNGGGNSMVANEFIRYLDVVKYYSFGGVDVRLGPYLRQNSGTEHTNKKNQDLVFDGNVYALTSVNTFSSALDFSVMLQDNGLGQIIGEIPGGMPSSYGDSLRFQLPNSKLGISISYKYFSRIDDTKSDLPLIPDYETTSKAAEEKLISIIKS